MKTQIQPRLDTKQAYVHNIVPPYILESIARNGTRTQRAFSQRTLELDREIRSRRERSRTRRERPRVRSTVPSIGPAHKERRIHTAANSTDLPGTLVRSEGGDASGDASVNEAYDGLGATFDLYWEIYARDSIDDSGLDLIGTVHYGDQFNNAFWDGTQMVFGDGDGTIFNRFTIAIDVMGHELTHGVTAATAALEHNDQPGALNESISDVFGSLVKQRSLGQTAAQADWLIGAGIFAAGLNAVALRSMKAPGTAYDDPLLGKDPQPDHMDNYVTTDRDAGGVHINSGIPNKAFYLAATAIGGNSWDVAGHIWYQTLLDSRLSAGAKFQDFANLTADNANTLYGASANAAVVRAWHDVGIDVAPLHVPGRLLSYGDAGTPGNVSAPVHVGRADWLDFKFLFAGKDASGENRMYAVDRNGQLLSYGDAGTPGNVSDPMVVGLGGWLAFKFVFAGRNAADENRIYAVDQNGQLLSYGDAGTPGNVSAPMVVGLGGWLNFKFLFAGKNAAGENRIYAVNQNGQLMSYGDAGTPGNVSVPMVVGLGGWLNFKFLFAGGNAAGENRIYAVVV